MIVEAKIKSSGRITNPTALEKNFGALYAGNANSTKEACNQKCAFRFEPLCGELCEECTERLGPRGNYLKGE